MEGQLWTFNIVLWGVMNTGTGASTEQRVKWPGFHFHVLNSPQEASPFTVNKFIQGQFWLPATGVPFWPGI